MAKGLFHLHGIIFFLLKFVASLKCCQRCHSENIFAELLNGFLELFKHAQILGG